MNLRLQTNPQFNPQCDLVVEGKKVLWNGKNGKGWQNCKVWEDGWLRFKGVSLVIGARLVDEFVKEVGNWIMEKGGRRWLLGLLVRFHCNYRHRWLLANDWRAAGRD